MAVTTHTELTNFQPSEKIERLDAVKQAIAYDTPHRSPNYALFALVADMASTLGLLVVVDYIARTHFTPSGISLIAIASLLIIWSATFFRMSVYDVSRHYRFVEETRRVMVSILLSTMLFMGFLYLAEISIPREVILTHAALDSLALVGWRFADRAVTRLTKAKTQADYKRVLIIGDGEQAKEVAEILQQFPKTEIVGFVAHKKTGKLIGYPILGGLNSDIRALTKQHDVNEVIIAVPNTLYDNLGEMLVELQYLPLQVRVVPTYVSLALYRPTVDDLAGLPLVNLQTGTLSTYQRMAKRAFDLVVSTLFLLMVMPIMAIIALAIKMDSPGPVFFKQNRVGENGKLFKMYKFRSMVINAEALQTKVNQTDENGNVIHKTRHDPRVTRVGRFIRKTSLDELPQFINVIRGEMSLVGPRPELPWLVEQYQPWQRQRFAVPQGITGWWQVNGRSDKPCHLNTDQDLYYIQNYSFWFDILILLKTVPALLKGSGAF